MKNTNLTIWHDPKLKLIFYIDHNCFFFSFYKDFKVVIRGFNIKHPIFIVETRDYNYDLR